MTVQVLASTHNSPESAFIIDDYPTGRTLRCFKRIWVETGTKGAGKGLQRICYQTTVKYVNHNKENYPSAPMQDAHLWNKVKAGVYGGIKILYVDAESGHVECDGLSQHAWPEHIAEFKRKVRNEPRRWTTCPNAEVRTSTSGCLKTLSRPGSGLILPGQSTCTL